MSTCCVMLALLLRLCCGQYRLWKFLDLRRLFSDRALVCSSHHWDGLPEGNRRVLADDERVFGADLTRPFLFLHLLISSLTQLQPCVVLKKSKGALKIIYEHTVTFSIINSSPDICTYVLSCIYFYFYLHFLPLPLLITNFMEVVLLFKSWSS